MIVPHQTNYMAANVMHADRLANAARMRLAGKQLHPRAGTPRIHVNRRGVAGALASLLLAVVVAAGVSATVNAAGTGGGGGGGGAVLLQ